MFTVSNLFAFEVTQGQLMTIVLILFYLTYAKEYSFIIRTPFQN